MTIIEHTEINAVSTPYETWCEARGVHPESPGAYECYAWSLEQTAP